ncbi:MAG TPA: hypothetical protein VMW72_17925 [Sedimentisphaerales bacterium]|nr:hypothetical protein [Sedimentisphaerales bacterium]
MDPEPNIVKTESSEPRETVEPKDADVNQNNQNTPNIWGWHIWLSFGISLVLLVVLVMMVDQADSVKPEVIVLSSSSFDAQIANEFAEKVRARENKPLLIGIGQSHYLNRNFNNIHEKHYDAILLGEPEQEFFTLFDQIRAQDKDDNDWRKYYWDCYENGKRFKVDDPDRLAFPNYTKDELESYRSIFPVQVAKHVVWGYLIATRGFNITGLEDKLRISIGTEDENDKLLTALKEILEL